MQHDLSDLISVIDQCLIDTAAATNGRQATIPVKTVAAAVVVVTGSGRESFPEVLKMVCQRTISKGHALAFDEMPFTLGRATSVEQKSARLN